MNTVIPWKSEYETGISEVDNQHKQLVDILNKLYEAMSVGKGKDVLESIFNELTSYTITHFSSEEKYMVVYAFPDTQNHKAQHKKLIEEVTRFKNDYANGNSKISINLANYLKNWILNHIQGSDKQMGKYLKDKGFI